MKRINIDFNKVYSSNQYGNYIILNEEPVINGIRHVKIKFLDTGTIRVIKLGHALSGEIRDPFKPVYYGLGYTGNVNNCRSHILYNKWCAMMSRCYNKNNPYYNSYGGIGIRVDSRWYCFETFIEDCKSLYNYDKFINNPSAYQLDKDYLQQNIPHEQRVYSKDTCIFLSNEDNNYLHSLEQNSNKNIKCEYIGVCKCNSNSWEVKIRINGKRHYIGCFSNPIAAANAYNYFYNKYRNNGIVNLVNDVPYMAPDEFFKYNTNPKQMIKIV